jgi:hypothetical protein
MGKEHPRLDLGRLVRGGFYPIGRWVARQPKGLSLEGDPPNVSGVYAFVIDEQAEYIGLASQSLAKRFYFYSRPGRGQKTNIRLNELITAQIMDAREVQVMVATPPDLDWKGWTICGAAGLEAGLIRSFRLPWNVRGTVSRPISDTKRPPEVLKSPESQSGKNFCVYPGKYGPLRTHLEGTGRDKVSMTFRQIEDLVGKLPKSAYLYQAWWGNHEGNSQAKGWMAARYLVEADPAHRAVIFRKFRY